MKRILQILIFLMLAVGSAFALEPAAIQIGRIEKSLWGLEYKNLDEKARLSRIEKDVFGAEYASKAIQARIDKINESLGLEGTIEENDVITKQVDEIQSKGVSYPVISSMENQILGKDYDGESIYSRLDRLENKVFSAKQTGDLNERTQRLAAKLSRVDSVANAPKAQQETIQDGYNNYDSYMGNQNDFYLQLSALEYAMYRKSYDHEPLSVRLSRLERKIFQRDFTLDDDALRVQRIQAAANAKKTAKYYDGYKFQKFASTGLQIGTIVLMILAMIL